MPPYVGHKGWVGAYLDTSRLDWAVLASLIDESYQLIAPKRLARQRAAPDRAAPDRAVARNAKAKAKKKPARRVNER